MFAKSKGAYLSLLVQGCQLCQPFPFNKGSRVEHSCLHCKGFKTLILPKTYPKSASIIDTKSSDFDHRHLHFRYSSQSSIVDHIFPPQNCTTVHLKADASPTAQLEYSHFSYWSQ
jgi:hypothetical protein